MLGCMSCAGCQTLCSSANKMLRCMHQQVGRTVLYGLAYAGERSAHDAEAPSRLTRGSAASTRHLQHTRLETAQHMK